MMDVDVKTTGAGGNPRKGDETLRVRFYMGAMQNPAKSKEAGRAVFDEVPFIRIQIPGDKYSAWDGPVWQDEDDSNSHVNRFREKWLAFKAGQGDAESGTLLREWPAITRGQVEELAYLKVKTVENLAALADGYVAAIPGGYALKAKAKDFLESAQSAAPMEKLRCELEARDNTIAALQAQQADMAQALAKLQAAQEKRKQ